MPVIRYFSRSKFPKTCELMESYGLESSQVISSTMDINGYVAVALDGKGQQIKRKNEKTGEPEVLTAHMRWPDAETALAVITQFIQEGGYKQ